MSRRGRGRSPSYRFLHACHQRGNAHCLVARSTTVSSICCRNVNCLVPCSSACHSLYGFNPGGLNGPRRTLLLRRFERRRPAAGLLRRGAPSLNAPNLACAGRSRFTVTPCPPRHAELRCPHPGRRVCRERSWEPGSTPGARGFGTRVPRRRGVGEHPGPDRARRAEHRSGPGNPRRPLYAMLVVMAVVTIVATRPLLG